MSRKLINESVGSCPCRVRGCDEVAQVKRQKNHEDGALYLVCPVDGIQRANTKTGQEKLTAYIKEHANFFTLEPGPEPEPMPEPEPKLEPKHTESNAEWWY